MAAPTIATLPDAPSRTDPDTFSTKSDALVAALAAFVSETNAVGAYYNSNALVEYAFGAGTVAAPSIHFDGDSDTGFYSPAANVIAFGSAGVERWRQTITRFELNTNLTVKTATEAQLILSPDAGDHTLLYARTADDTFGIKDNANSRTWLKHVGTTDAEDQVITLMEGGGELLVGNVADGFPANESTGTGFAVSKGGRSGFLSEDSAVNICRHTTIGNAVQLYYNGVIKGSISVTASATSFNTSSDYRLKENITPIQGASDIVMAMQPCTYTAIADNLWYDGFLAHELQEVYPRAVTGVKDKMVDEEYEVSPATETEDAVMGVRSVPDMQSVDYSKLTPILTAALQEAIGRIALLEARVSELEG